MTEPRPPLDTTPFRGGWALNSRRFDQDPGRDVAKEEVVPKRHISGPGRCGDHGKCDGRAGSAGAIWTKRGTAGLSSLAGSID